jgi:signal peptidase I
LSLFVPGFGLVRAGRPLRGLVWFVGFQFIGVATALLFIARSLPNWIVGAGILAGIGGFVAMLVDSFRPGRLNWPLSVSFVIACLALAALPSLPQLVAKSFKVPTAAMEPTLIGASKGKPDHIIADRVSYLISPPKRGDLVVFRTNGIVGVAGDALFVKRLVGLPGERIEIRDGGVFADGKLLDEGSGIPPITYVLPESGLRSVFPSGAGFTVPLNGFFVLGDNSTHSFDSRYWGAVPRENIYGRVARIYYPWSRIGVPR